MNSPEGIAEISVVDPADDDVEEVNCASEIQTLLCSLDNVPQESRASEKKDLKVKNKVKNPFNLINNAGRIHVNKPTVLQMLDFKKDREWLQLNIT